MRMLAVALNVVTALVMGFFGLRVMFTPLNLGRFYWWPLAMFGAPILLMVGGVRILFPHLKQIFLLTLCAGILFLTWLTFIHYLSWTYCIFAIAEMLTCWGVLSVSSAVNSDGLLSLVAGALLVLSWIPASIETVRAQLKDFLVGNLANLVLLLFFWALMISSCVLAFMLTKSPGIEAVPD